MSGITFGQLRTATDPGLEGSGATDQIQVKAGTGVAVGSGGVGIDGTATVPISTGAWNFGASATLTQAATSFTGTDVPNADWVLSQIATGVAWKFPVLADTQLDDTNDAVSQATVMYLANQPTAGDTISITDGVTTRTYGATSGGDVQFTIGTTVADTMANLASAITVTAPACGTQRRTPA